MGRKQRSAARPRQLADGESIPVVGGREPCPCGSGRRYKACHGREQADVVPLNPRPFADFAGELDLIALHTFVPSATAPLTLLGEESTKATLATVLPLAAPALRRTSGEVIVAAQTLNSSGDPSRDLAHSLERALRAQPGETLSYDEPPAGTTPLAELIDPKAALELTLHDTFEYWFESEKQGQSTADQAISLERANAAIEPTVKLASVDSAYWVRRSTDRCHLRWVMPQDEDPLLDALARLHAADALRLGEGSKYAGSLRACGRLIVVWDLAVDTPAEHWEQPTASLADRLGNAFATAAPLSSAERRSRSGLTNRQLTLR